MSPFSVVGAASVRSAAVVSLGAAAIAVSAGCAPPIPSAPGGDTSFTIVPTDSRVGFGSTSLPAPSTLPPDMAEVNRSDATAVSAVAVRIWFTADTRVDSSPHDARLRACPLLTPPYCLAIRNFPPMTGPGADWLALTAQRAAITVGAADVRPAAEAGPSDSATRADRLWEVTEHLGTPNGVLPDIRLVVAVGLTRDGARWEVTEVRTR